MTSFSLPVLLLLVSGAFALGVGVSLLLGYSVLSSIALSAAAVLVTIVIVAFMEAKGL